MWWPRIWLSLWLVLPTARLWSWFVRRLKGEHNAPRQPVPTFATVALLSEYLRARWDYRSDELGGLRSHWITDPEVLQARLDGKGDGDCDDSAAWGLVALEKCPEVELAYLLEVGYRRDGKKRAHATAVYRTTANGWWLFDYGNRYRVADAAGAVAKVVSLYGDASGARWYAFRRPLWTAVGICKTPGDA